MPVLLDRMNVRFDDLLATAGLPQASFARDKDLLPLRDVLAIVEGAARATGIECFSVLLGASAGLDALGDYGSYIKAAPILLEAIRRADRYISWQSLGVRLSLTREGAAYVWRYHLPHSVRADRQHAYLFALVLMRDIVRLAAGPNWTPSEVRLERAPLADHTHRVEEEFGGRIIWGAGENALVFGQNLLSRPMLRVPGVRLRDIVGDVAIALDSDMPPKDFVGSLRRLIRSLLPAGYPHVEILAHASGRSLRSFQRALAQLGLNFSDLVEQVRFEMATELMADPRARLIDIALELGYSDAANFTHAFVRWTGQAPKLFRRNLRP